MHKLLMIVGLGLFFTNNAYAYLDYGTGSLLIQAAVSFFGIMVMYLVSFRLFLLSLCKRAWMHFKKKSSYTTKTNRDLSSAGKD
ncbi:MAG: hypothetical protein A3F18_02835 [Legionellales bacterium RIFCSPHIGHO2_12_FULL_37_14]|nr:MAG: hypothetical protein A3F18_02835 [Legionellales bacterium RIFCSPHIGHO2_12_FULL_37_14]